MLYFSRHCYHKMAISYKETYTHNSDHPKIPPVEPVVELFAIAMILFLNIHQFQFRGDKKKMLYSSLPNHDNDRSFTHI